MMSEYEAEEMMNKIDRWDAKHAKREFIARMERKLHRKEHVSRH